MVGSEVFPNAGQRAFDDNSTEFAMIGGWKNSIFPDMRTHALILDLTSSATITGFSGKTYLGAIGSLNHVYEKIVSERKIRDTGEFKILAQERLNEQSNISTAGEWILPADINKQLRDAQTVPDLLKILSTFEDQLKTSSSWFDADLRAFLHKAYSVISEFWVLVKEEPARWVRDQDIKRLLLRPWVDKKDISEKSESADRDINSLQVKIIDRERLEGSLAEGFDLWKKVLDLFRAEAAEIIQRERYTLEGNRVMISLDDWKDMHRRRLVA